MDDAFERWKQGKPAVKQLIRTAHHVVDNKRVISLETFYVPQEQTSSSDSVQRFGAPISGGGATRNRDERIHYVTMTKLGKKMKILQQLNINLCYTYGHPYIRESFPDT